MARTATPQSLGSGARMLPNRVLVALDGTSTSIAAEAAGVELAVLARASLIVVSVIDLSGLRLPGGRFFTRVDQVRDERERALSQVVHDAQRRGISAQFLIWEGDPGSGLVEAAAAERADLIVMGSRALGPVGRLLLGSVSSYVLANAGCPVLLFRKGDRLVDVWPDVVGVPGAFAISG